MRALTPIRRLLVGVALLACVACTEDTNGSSAPTMTTPTTAPATTAPAPLCGPEITEPLDSASLQHALPAAAEPTYLTDPPTSGPHVAGPPIGGVLDATISRPRQVGQLEVGGILVQHRNLEPAEHQTLRPIAAEKVAVAPNPDLPDRVVATAWLTKLTCRAVDLDALKAFVTAHIGKGPGGHG